MHRADHHHGRAGGADEARQHRRRCARSDRVDARRAVDVAAHEDAAGDREQRQQQQDERDVFEKRRVDERLQRRGRPDEQRHGNEHQQAPEGRDLALVMLPGMRREKREQRDRQQDADEGQRPGDAERATRRTPPRRRLVGQERQERQRGPGPRRERRTAFAHEIPRPARRLLGD